MHAVQALEESAAQVQGLRAELEAVHEAKEEALTSSRSLDRTASQIQRERDELIAAAQEQIFQLQVGTCMCMHILARFLGFRALSRLSQHLVAQLNLALGNLKMPFMLYGI